MRLPMQKNSTLNYQTDVLSRNVSDNLSPKESTIQTILQFAASYHITKLADNRFVEVVLN